MAAACAPPPDQAGPEMVARGPILMRLAALALVPGLAIFLLFFRLGYRDLDGSHEARAALNARWYLEHPGPGPSLLPDGTLEAQKPPAYYWAVAAITRCLGSDTPDGWTTRLPAALSGLLVVGALGLLAGWRGGPAQGQLAAGLLISMAAFVWLSRTARTDAPLGAAIALGLLALEAGRGTRAWVNALWCLLASLCFACGWLIKGPMAVVMPAAVLACRVAMEPKNLAVWRWAFGGGCALVGGSLLALPWFWHADQVSMGQFSAEFFGLHHVGRGLGGTRLREHPWWFYLAQFPASTLPASLLIPLTLWWSVRTSAARQPEQGWLARLGVAWVAGGLILLSLARFKRADYLAPLFPGLALWLATSLWPWLQTLQAGWPHGALMGRLAATCALGVWCAGWGWWVSIPNQGAGHGRAELAAAISGARGSGERLVFFQVEDHLLAHHLGSTFETLVTWPPLREAASLPGGVLVVTEPERLGEGWFVDPSMRVEPVLPATSSNPTKASGKPLVCVRLRALTDKSGAEDRADAAIPSSPIAGGPTFLLGDR